MSIILTPHAVSGPALVRVSALRIGTVSHNGLTLLSLLDRVGSCVVTHRQMYRLKFCVETNRTLPGSWRPPFQ